MENHDRILRFIAQDKSSGSDKLIGSNSYYLENNVYGQAS